MNYWRTVAVVALRLGPLTKLYIYIDPDSQHTFWRPFQHDLHIQILLCSISLPYLFIQIIYFAFVLFSTAINILPWSLLHGFCVCNNYLYIPNKITLVIGLSIFLLFHSFLLSHINIIKYRENKRLVKKNHFELSMEIIVSALCYPELK